MHITFLTLAFIILLFASFATDKFDYQPCSGITFLFMHLELHHVFPSFNALPSVYLYLPQWSFSLQLEWHLLKATVYGPWCSKAGMIWPFLYSYSALFTHLLWLLLQIICYCSSVYIFSLLYYKAMKAAAESQSFFSLLHFLTHDKHSINTCGIISLIHLVNIYWVPHVVQSITRP